MMRKLAQREPQKPNSTTSGCRNVEIAPQIFLRQRRKSSACAKEVRANGTTENKHYLSVGGQCLPSSPAAQAP